GEDDPDPARTPLVAAAIIRVNQDLVDAQVHSVVCPLGRSEPFARMEGAEEAKGLPEWVVGSPPKAIVAEKILETIDFQDSTHSCCPVAEGMLDVVVKRPTSFNPAHDQAARFGHEALAGCREKLHFFDCRSVTRGQRHCRSD